MHLIFNELSVYPLAIDLFSAKKRIFQLLQTYKLAASRFSFNHIRCPENYASILMTEDRLSYFLEAGKVTFIACKGHYKFH